MAYTHHRMSDDRHEQKRDRSGTSAHDGRRGGKAAYSGKDMAKLYKRMDDDWLSKRLTRTQASEDGAASKNGKA